MSFFVSVSHHRRRPPFRSVVYLREESCLLWPGVCRACQGDTTPPKGLLWRKIEGSRGQWASRSQYKAFFTPIQPPIWSSHPLNIQSVRLDSCLSTSSLAVAQRSVVLGQEAFCSAPLGDEASICLHSKQGQRSARWG